MKNDDYIINLFWDRSEKAIEEIDKRYYKLCFGIAWNLLMNREDSEECVSDTWFTAWKTIPPKKPNPLSAYLAKITRGFAIDLLRKKTASKRVPEHLCDIIEETEKLNVLVTHSIENHISEKELIHLIDDFLENLSYRDRDIFLQRYWKIEQTKSIAHRHKLSEGAVKQSLVRSKKKLQYILEKEGYL